MIRLQVRWTGLNTGWSNFHFGGDLSTASASASALSTFLNVLDNAMINTQLWAIETEVAEVDVSTGQTTAVGTISASTGVGMASGDPVPQAAMALIRWRTGAYLSGREIRGRTFVPGLSGALATTGGEVDTATITAFNGAAATLISGSDIGVYSPTHAAFASATSANTWTEWAVLRSRRD